MQFTGPETEFKAKRISDKGMMKLLLVRNLVCGGGNLNTSLHQT